LPVGLTLNPATGLITGAATAVGRSMVEVSASDGQQTMSSQFVWEVSEGGATRFVRFEARSEVAGNPWSSAAELNLLGEDGQPLPRAAWTISADSAELVGENGAAQNAIDGNPATMWHSQWQGANPPPPHWLRVDLGGEFTLTGLRYTPRQGASRNGMVGDAVSLSLTGSDPDGDALTYAALGLPAGLVLNAASGVISGAPTAPGNYTVTASVSDGRGGSASAEFVWLVGMAPPTVQPVVAPIAASGLTASYSANAGGSGPLEYQWSFGDGTPIPAFSASPNVSHTFAGPEVYRVTLTVRNIEGDSVSTQFVQGVATPALAGSPRASSNLAEELRAGQSARIWVANIDNDTVSVFDRVTLSKLSEVPVGSSPRSVSIAPDGRVWVTNKGSSTISIIDPATLAVAATVSLPRARRFRSWPGSGTT